MTTQLFDSHFHIIDPSFPLTPNKGYLPDAFTAHDYQKQIQQLGLNVTGGAVVSGSFQAFDQAYLIDALQKLGSNFVGVTNLAHDATDEEIIQLNQAGVRAVRFNLYRGGSENVKHLKSTAKRIHELVNWHVELYVDSSDLKTLSPILLSLPKVSIDHLGLSKTGFNDLVALAEKGVHVKATGFMRVDFDVATALKTLYKANPDALMFGTDLPGTRAPRVFNLSDLAIIQNNFDKEAAHKILCGNAMVFYGLDD